MPYSEFNKTASDGVTLAFQVWTPEVSPVGVVCLVHGLGEHVGRYENVANTLTEASHALIGFDQRGHGKTPGPRGVTPRFDRLMDDITLLLDEAHNRWPRKPMFLYGHSMGGTWVLHYAIRRAPTVAGLIVSAPLLRTAFKPPAAKVAVGKILYRVAPNVVLANGVERPALSRDAEVVRAYAADPLVHDRMSARLALDLVQGGQWALDHAGEFPSLPLLLMHGDCDRLTSAGATGEFADRVRGDVTFKLWPDCYHETHNEPNRAEVLAYMIDWLNNHLPAN